MYDFELCILRSIFNKIVEPNARISSNIDVLFLITVCTFSSLWMFFLFYLPLCFPSCLKWVSEFIHVYAHAIISDIQKYFQLKLMQNLSYGSLYWWVVLVSFLSPNNQHFYCNWIAILHFLKFYENNLVIHSLYISTPYPNAYLPCFNQKYNLNLYFIFISSLVKN